MKNPLHHIRRKETHREQAWEVRLRLVHTGKDITKRFPDSRYGHCKERSLRAAMHFRDQRLTDENRIANLDGESTPVDQSPVPSRN